MNPRREKARRQIVLGILLLLIAGGLYWYGNHAPRIETFAQCAAEGFPVMESYPRQCRRADGKVFKEDIGNELEKDNLIRISEPRPNAIIQSPLLVKGMARGSWFFEASFPIRLFDGSGEMMAKGMATANPPAGGEWMTTDFVPFEAILSFTLPTTTSGTLLLERDNPSGLPENTDALRIPIRF